MVQQLGKVMNEDLRIEIVKMVKRSGEGHIPSSFSIVDILDYLYGKVLNVRPDEPDWEGRDYFILSKGHGCGAFYAVLHKYGFLTDQDIEDYSTSKGILGGHPDATIVPGQNGPASPPQADHRGLRGSRGSARTAHQGVPAEIKDDTTHHCPAIRTPLQ